MPVRASSPLVAAVCGVALAALGCGPRSLLGCSSDADCSGASYCFQGVCRGDEAPMALVTAPAYLVSHTPLPFDASPSTDPDPGDHVAAYAWTTSVVSASCAPDPSFGSGPVFTPVFTCPGSFEIQLVVT